jgi:hypothetical protein
MPTGLSGLPCPASSGAARSTFWRIASRYGCVGAVHSEASYSAGTLHAFGTGRAALCGGAAVPLGGAAHAALVPMGAGLVSQPCRVQQQA